MQKAPPTPKGFRDILPQTAKKRREVINTIAQILESHGFEPLETPTLEFAETLSGKYGDEEKLIYKFTDRGNRELALRYDLTVPLARFVANNQNLLNPTFSRYQIGQVFRGENPQHGRYREFTQFDFDTVGPSGPEEDAKIIATAIEAAKAITSKKLVMAINDRKNFEQIPIEVIRSVDKIDKVGRDEVEKELAEKNFKKSDIDSYLEKILNSQETELYKKIADTLTGKYHLSQGHNPDFYFDNSLARGLDYYTGSIFELKLEGDQKLSYGAGGRYDNLIGMFVYPERSRRAGKQIQAVGFSFGIDRIVDLL